MPNLPFRRTRAAPLSRDRPFPGICTVEVGTYIMPHLRVYSLYSS